MSELITVPTFTFKQGSYYGEDFELPITISYFNGSIQLQQDGDFTQPESIVISPAYLEKLFREIKKHLPTAEKILKDRK